MTVRFGNYRLLFYLAVLMLSGTILGISGHFASIFLPHLHRDFTIFSLIVPSLTILLFLLSLQWAQPRTEAVVLFIIGVLWLTMGAWATDIIGTVQCDTLGGLTTASNSGQTSSQAFCYQMKVIQAFSWALFIMYFVALLVLFQLVHLSQRFGRVFIWSEPIRELPWYGEMPGYHIPANTGAVQMPMYSYPYGPLPYGYGPSAPMITQAGPSIMIQPGMNGHPPVVTQVPMAVA